MVKKRSLWFISPGCVEIRDENRNGPSEGEVGVRAIISAISPGTEMLIYRGQVETDMAVDEVIESLAGSFQYPFQYGYASVGMVEEIGIGVDPDWLGARVFSFHPHESYYYARPETLMRIPDGVSNEDAVFLPNMETAVNFLHDGAPRLGEDAAVFGLGIVGLLSVSLLSAFPLNTLIGVDPYPLRRAAALEIGVHHCVDPETLGKTGRAMLPHDKGFDLIYELSGAPSALEQAISAAGYEGRVVIGSWYGNKPVVLNLGGQFHRSRIQIISSQVSTVQSGLTGRWSKKRRFETAWKQIQRIRPSKWITHRFPLDQAQAAYQHIDRHAQDTIQVVFVYD